MRVPSLKKERNALKKIVRKLKSFCRFLRKSGDEGNGMYVLSVISLPLYGSPLGRKLNTFLVLTQIRLVMLLLRISKPVYYVNCPPAIEVIEKLGKTNLVYERTDFFPAQPGVDKSYITSLDNKLADTADLVLYVNHSLWKEGVKVNPNSLLLGHGVDYDYFVKLAQSNKVPEDMEKITKPIVGYFGEISDKHIDLELVRFIIEKLPQLSFVFVGPVSTDISRLNQFENVHFLGQKPYPEIPLYGKEFNVAIMPWNQSEWIQHCNPVKIKEYLALGKPVVSTYYPEIEPYSEIVTIARNYEEFVIGIEKSIAENNPEMVAQRQLRVRNETWDNKVSQIREKIEDMATD